LYFASWYFLEAVQMVFPSSLGLRAKYFLGQAEPNRPFLISNSFSRYLLELRILLNGTPNG